MPTKTVAKGITRFDLENRRGYMVRIARSGNRVHQYFSDSKYGGKRKALAAAKAAYADLLEEMGPAENSTRDKLTSRNTTGIVGVHVAYSQDNRYPGCEYYAYCASWVTEAGKREKASFAWNKYGEDDALELAILARQHQITDRDQVVALYEGSTGSKRTKRSKKASKQATQSSRRNTKKSQAKKTAKKRVKKSARKPAKKSVKRAAKKSVKKKTKQTKAAGKKPAAKKAATKKTTTKKTAKKSAVKKAAAKKKRVKKKTAKKTTKKAATKKPVKKKSGVKSGRKKTAKKSARRR
ncbi:pathogenesis-related transcriptional factor and ERF protein [Allorhodopirellula solitaria]|uniref:AP2 domain protein n=1 Tax=Allorhodopirellula solitaria TaxID=2527987 RepID=A0A5C5YK33_9BACT|nr:pathogenesis-related transcriptional factor and ERF protein [Allorhodopirellula solitaria]TWT75178.1 hypothetical protein CA85_04670 [Allorhodopirellula solitaria]